MNQSENLMNYLEIVLSLKVLNFLKQLFRKMTFSR
jgi:hypothetical protein